MATLLADIRSRVRTKLQESSASTWSEAELLEDMIGGIKDLWRAINDLHQEHFCTIDETNMSIAASASTVTGVPSDLYRLHMLEPRDLTSDGAYRELIFVPRDLNSADFQRARSIGTIDPGSGGIVCFAVIGAGAPVAAPTIRIAPKLSAAVDLTAIYVPTFAASAYNDPDTDYNPIPGESDDAIVAWTIAWARSKEREDRSPDPEWLAVYATFKQIILTSLTPRQTQEPDEVEGMFADEY